jgi:hypothetical protein
VRASARQQDLILVLAHFSRALLAKVELVTPLRHADDALVETRGTDQGRNLRLVHAGPVQADFRHQRKRGALVRWGRAVFLGPPSFLRTRAIARYFLTEVTAGTQGVNDQDRDAERILFAREICMFILFRQGFARRQCAALWR